MNVCGFYRLKISDSVEQKIAHLQQRKIDILTPIQWGRGWEEVSSETIRNLGSCLHYLGWLESMNEAHPQLA